VPPLALVPVNRLDAAKGRLAGILTPAQREQLVLATARTVVEAALGAGLQVMVLTPDARVSVGLPAGVRVLPERAELQGLNAQLDAAVESIDAEELVILHADLPLASERAIRSLLAVAFRAPSVTLVESGDGGTNVLLLRPPGRFALAYGPGSAATHRQRALSAGLLPLTFGEPSLRLDLDTPADIRTLLASDEGRASPAGQLLMGWGLEARLESAPPV